MTTSFEQIKRYYNLCRPNEPISPDDPRWVDLAPLRGSGRDVVQEMARQVELEERFATLLLTGFRGTGKTSVLKAYQALLEIQGYQVVYTDAEADYLVNPNEVIGANDVLLVAAMVLMDNGFGPNYLKRLWDDVRAFGGAHVLPKEVEVEAGTMAFKAALERIPALHETLRRFARERAIYEQVSRLVAETQAEVKRRKKKGLVLVVDGLDHLFDPPEREGSPVTESVLTVLRESPELRRLDAHIVLTVPPTVLPHAHNLRADYGELFIVPEARIFTRKDERDEKSFNGMDGFVNQRVPLECFDSIDSARSLIAASGGYLRDFLRLLRQCLFDIEELPITGETVKRAIERSVAQSADLPLEDYRSDLEAIKESKEHRLPRDEAHLQRMYKMIRDRVLLSYRNDSSWEGIHPLVMAHIDEPTFKREVFPSGE